MPKGNLEIDILDASEVSVPLDADGRKGVNDCLRIRREFEQPKAKLLQKYGDELRTAIKGDDNSFGRPDCVFAIRRRSKGAQRDGIANRRGGDRSGGRTRWGGDLRGIGYQTAQYELIENKEDRQLMAENFPDGLRITAVKGHIMDLENRKRDGSLAGVPAGAHEEDHVRTARRRLGHHAGIFSTTFL